MKANNTQRVFRITILDALGQPHAGLVRIGDASWPCSTVASCPVVALWDATETDESPVPASSKPKLIDWL